MIKYPYILHLVILATFACGATPAIQTGQKPDTRQLSLDDGVLALEDCRLTFGAETYALDLPGQCQFSVDRNGNPEARQTPHGICGIVMSINPIEGSEDCDTYLKGVLVRNGQVWISKEQQLVAMCDDGPLDQKTFAIFAEEIAHQSRQ